MSLSLAGESLRLVAPFTASPSVWLLGVASGMLTASTGLGGELLGNNSFAELTPADLSLDKRLGGFGGILGFKGTLWLGEQCVGEGLGWAVKWKLQVAATWGVRTLVQLDGRNGMSPA